MMSKTVHLITCDVQDSIVTHDVQGSIIIVTYNVQDSIKIVTHDAKDGIHILIHVQDTMNIVITVFENIWKEAQQ